MPEMCNLCNPADNEHVPGCPMAWKPERGMRVLKSAGAYRGSGWTIVAVFETMDYKQRLVCESEDVNGLLHIFAPGQVNPIR